MVLRMDPFFSQIVLTPFLLLCLGSFVWATRRFFVKQHRISFGLKLTLAAGLVSALLHLWFLISAKDLHPLQVVAAQIMYVLSLAVFWSAIRANRLKPLSACFSTDEKLHLVQNGIYRWIRHPFYTSYLLTWLAGAVATLEPVLFGVFAFMATLYVIAARAEEAKFARSSLAGAYVHYKQTTGQFIPIPWKHARRGLKTQHPLASSHK